MGTRRDDIPESTRMQIATAMLAPDRPAGLARRLARTYGLSRQAIHALAAQAQTRLAAALRPRPPGPPAPAATRTVDRPRLVRAVLQLTAVGVSQRDICACLQELLDTDVSLGWVAARLADLETAAAGVTARWQPSCGESLAADELFANRAPQLLVVGNDSLYIYALTRQAQRDGDTWGCVFLDLPPAPAIATDGGSGLAAGLAAAGRAHHERDWDHLLRALWGHAASLERRAYGAIAAVEERARLFDGAHTAGRLQGHLACWERLVVAQEAAIAAYDRFAAQARAVDGEFGMIDLASGAVRAAAVSVERLQAAGQAIQALGGRACQALGTSVTNWAEGLVSYRARLATALGTLEARWGGGGVRALARRWQAAAEVRRGHQGVVAGGRLQAWGAASLAAAQAALGGKWEQAWEEVAALLGQIWRGSMAVECVNSLLRRQLAAAKQTDQGRLELFRFLHNTGRFARGKRRGQSPAERVGIVLPADRFTLLGLPPKCQSNVPVI